MKIFTSPQIRKCDAFTIENEPVTSLALMERASAGCAGWPTAPTGRPGW